MAKRISRATYRWRAAPACAARDARRASGTLHRRMLASWQLALRSAVRCVLLRKTRAHARRVYRSAKHAAQRNMLRIAHARGA